MWNLNRREILKYILPSFCLFGLPTEQITKVLPTDKKEVMFKKGGISYFLVDGDLVRTESEWCKRYFLNGKHHREDGPAIEYVNGDKHWYLNGKLHREDEPAICASGNKWWYLNGKHHRENGLPAVEYASGNKVWYSNGVPTRYMKSGKKYRPSETGLIAEWV